MRNGKLRIVALGICLIFVLQMLPLNIFASLAPLDTDCEHVWSEWSTDIEPGCETEGQEYRQCSECSEIEYRPIPATGHDFVFDSYEESNTGTLAKYVCTKDPGHVELRPTESTQLIAISDGNVRVDDVFELEISLVNNPGVISVRFNFEFDESMLQLLGATDTELLACWTTPSRVRTSPYILRWSDGLALENNDANGVIAKVKFKALKEGTTGIKINFIESRKTDRSREYFYGGTSTVEIGPAPVRVTGIEVSPSSAELTTADGTFELSATVYPENADNKGVNWITGDPSVATVDDGVVTITGHGIVTITAVTEDGGFESECVLAISCSHLNTGYTETVPSTCTEQGVGPYLVCLDCGEALSEGDLLPLADHSFREVTLVEPSCEKAGLYASICSECGTIGGYWVQEKHGHDFADGKCTWCSAEKYDVTVSYVFTGAPELDFSVSEYYFAGDRYSFDTKAFSGYTYDIARVSGIVNGDVSVTVTYTPLRQNVILSVSSVDFGAVTYGTPFAALGLPGTVSAVTTSGSSVDLKAIWMIEDYDPFSLGSQTIRGYVSGAYGYDTVCGFETELTLTVEPVVITGCVEFDAGVYPYGTLKDELIVPGYAALTDAAGGELVLPVEWDDFTLEGTETGTYIAKGNIELPDGYVIEEGADAEPSLRFVILPEDSEEYVPADDMIMGETVYELTPGEVAELDLFVVPFSEQYALLAESDDTGIVLTAGSKLYAVAPGETYVTVKTTEGISREVIVRVVEKEEISQESVIASTGAVTLNIGETFDLNAVVYPYSEENEITYSFDEGSAVLVDETGRITAVSGGTAIVTLTAEDGTVRSEIYVRVIDEGENAPAFKVENVSGLAGKNVILTVSLENNPGIISLRNYIWYDSEYLELVKVENLRLLKGYTTPAADISSPYLLRWADSRAESNNTACGELVRLTFKISENAPEGEYSVRIFCRESRNVDGELADFLNASATVTVLNYIVGDCDGDGEVTDWDAILLDRYLANWHIENINLEAMDIDGDGEVTDWDAILLDRYLANWQITI